jgi:hypothetical protein
MAVLAPVAVLFVVVGLGIAGRFMSGPGPAASTQAQAAVAVAVAVGPSRTPIATLDPDARPTVIPFPPLMPFVAAQREHGTDGLMGRLPFDLPPDPVAARNSRFTIDDVVAARTAWDTTPPWVRRLGALSGYRTDPYQR